MSTVADELRAKLLAKLANISASTGLKVDPDSVLGKRKNDALSTLPTLEQRRLKKKVSVPYLENPHVNYINIINGAQVFFLDHTNCRVVVKGKGVDPDSNEDLHVWIGADSDADLNKGESELLKLFKNPNDPIYQVKESGSLLEYVMVPNQKVGLLIGKQGETIKNLIQSTGCRIQIAKEGEGPVGPDRRVSLEGSRQEIERAKLEIHKVVSNEAYQEQQKQQKHGLGFRHDLPPGHREVRMKIPVQYVGLVIGKQGDTIRQLQARSGATVVVQREPADPNRPNDDREVTITGTEDTIEKARREVDKIITDAMERAAEKDPSVRPPGAMKIPSSCVGSLIGKNGDNIRRLAQTTGCRIQISQDTTQPEREITLIGDPQAQERARIAVMNVVEDRLRQLASQSQPGPNPMAYAPPNPYAPGPYGYAPNPYAPPPAQYYDYYRQPGQPTDQQEQQQQQHHQHPPHPHSEHDPNGHNTQHPPSSSESNGSSDPNQPQNPYPSSAPPSTAPPTDPSQAQAYDYAAAYPYMQDPAYAQYYAQYYQNYYAAQAQQQQQAADPNASAGAGNSNENNSVAAAPASAPPAVAPPSAQANGDLYDPTAATEEPAPAPAPSN